MLGGSHKFEFLNMDMWHIKLKGMNSSPGCSEKFYSTIKLLTLGSVKGSIYLSCGTGTIKFDGHCYDSLPHAADNQYGQAQSGILCICVEPPTRES